MIIHDFADYADFFAIRGYLPNRSRMNLGNNQQLLVFVARIITEPGAKRLHAREKNTIETKRLLPERAVASLLVPYLRRDVKLLFGCGLRRAKKSE